MFLVKHHVYFEATDNFFALFFFKIEGKEKEGISQTPKHFSEKCLVSEQFSFQSN